MGCSLAVIGLGCGSDFVDATSGTAGAGGDGASGGATGTGGDGASGGATSNGGGGSGGASTTSSTTGGAGGADPIVIVQATQMDIDWEDVPTLSWDTPPAQGNTVIVGITCFSDVDNCTIPPGGVTDNHGNGYQLVIEGDTIVSQPTHGSRGYLFIAENVTVTSDMFTITVDPNGIAPPATQNLIWGAIEVSGLVPNSLDQIGMFPNTGGMITSTTVATDGPTAQGNELAVAVHTMRSNDTDVAYTHEPDWTEHHVSADGQSIISAHSMVTTITTAPDVVSHTWTHDEPTRGVAAIIATFRGQ